MSMSVSVGGKVTTPAGVNVAASSYRIGRGSGVFAVGAPREAEFGLRIDF